MIKIIIIFFAIIIIVGIIVRKYNNPYKLTFLFGKKGSGKSTYMVKCMKKDIRRGWTVYTNMADVKLNVRFFDINDLSKCTPDKHSSIYIDEAGLIWDNRNFKNFDKGYTEFFKLQRKYECKMMINSQSFDIDLKIRQLVDSMILFTSIGGFLSFGRPIIRSVTLTEPVGDAESRVADRLRFDRFWKWKITLLPRYFKYFDSFAAPARPKLPYRELVTSVSKISDKNVRRSLKRETVETQSK